MTSVLPCSLRKVQFSASAYLVRSWKMWPTSMPRTMSSVPLPSGDASPETTLRISATSGSGRSRPKFTPVRCVSTALAPQAKSAMTATARSATTRIPGLIPTGPIKPGMQPSTSLTSSSRAKRKAPTPSSLLALISFNSWSPRSRSSTSPALPPSGSSGTMARVLTRPLNGMFSAWATSSQRDWPGVATCTSGALAAGREPVGASASASSTLAA